MTGLDNTFEGQPEQLCASHPAGHTSGVGYEIFASGQPDKPLCTHGFYSESFGRLGASTTGVGDTPVAEHTGDHSGEATGIRYLLSKFSDINAMTKAQSMLTCWSRRLPLSDIRIRLESWLKIVSQSQGLFPPKNICQMLPLPFIYRGISCIGSKNRLGPFSLVRYHGVPVAYLPIVSNKDEDLTTLLLNLAHVDKSQTDPAEAHLSKFLTMQRLRTGFHACIITQVGKLVSRYIANCTHCNKLKASVVPVEKCGIKRLTRSQVAESGIDVVDGVSEEQAASNLEDMVKAARKGMTKCSFFVAHSNSQHINGISEGNTRSAKTIMKSLIGSIQKSQCTYPSFVKVISTFERVADLLNSRPIFHSPQFEFSHVRQGHHVSVKHVKQYV